MRGFIKKKKGFFNKVYLAVLLAKRVLEINYSYLLAIIAYLSRNRRFVKVFSIVLI